MADETTDKPLATLAGSERAIDPPVIAIDPPTGTIDLSPGRTPDGWVSSEPVPAADRIRAFEDEYLGKDAVRIGGQIERGYGSRFRDHLTDEQRRQHAALEKLVAAEQKLAAAHAALIQADIEHDAALAAAEPKPDAE